MQLARALVGVPAHAGVAGGQRQGRGGEAESPHDTAAKTLVNRAASLLPQITNSPRKRSLLPPEYSGSQHPGAAIGCEDSCTN